jgi:hypothetical protein
MELFSQEKDGAESPIRQKPSSFTRAIVRAWVIVIFAFLKAVWTVGIFSQQSTLKSLLSRTHFTA